jgi:acylphosphatase
VNEQLQATVRGQVQGVGYRWFVRRLAAQLGVSGWVANQADGSVLVVAEGPPATLHDLLDQLHRGPSGAHVQSIAEEWLPAGGAFAGFDIRSGGHSGD